MIINLKQIRSLDADNIKLDKINYNFDQLVANGGGPKGYIGLDGDLGPQGFQGAVGVQGERGYQGVQGPPAESATKYWESIPQNLAPSQNIMSTLFAKHPISTAEIATIVGAGYISPDSGYSNQQSSKYQWVINRISSNVNSNLRFTSEGVTIGNAFDITMDNSEGLYKLYLGFINNQNSQLNLEAQKHIISSSNTGDILFNISSIPETEGGSTHTNTFFEKSVTFNESLGINDSTAGENKIAASVDDTGYITFKTSEELGGNTRVGTIISILPSVFSDSNNFVNYQNIDTNLDLNNPLKIRMGAGIGDYLGWYICNGQEWTDGTILKTFQVPDLNSFSYQIINNPKSTHPNSQGSINVVNDEVQLIGGAPIDVVGNWVGGTYSQYDVNLTINLTDPQISSSNAGVYFKIKKLPQIIYLGDIDLYWQQLGIDQNVLGDYNQIDYSPTDYNAI